MDNQTTRQRTVSGRLSLGVIAALLLTLAAALLAQDGTTDADRQALLQQSLTRLTRAEAHMDAPTKRLAPTFRDIITRVCLDRAEATESEVHIYSALMALGKPAGADDMESRSIDAGSVLDQLGPAVHKAPGVRIAPKITSGQRAVPGGQVGFVTLKMGARSKTIAEIPVSAGGLSPDKRAASVAQRMRTVSRTNPLWWSRIRVGQKNGSYVVACADAPEGYILTADAGFARERGVEPAALSKRLVSDIRSTYDSLAGGARSADDATPEEQQAAEHEAAVDLRLKGDEAYGAGKVAAAEQDYLAAMKHDSSYPVLYERLSALYLAQHQVQKAHQLAQQGQALPNLAPDQRQNFQQILNRSR